MKLFSRFLVILLILSKAYGGIDELPTNTSPRIYVPPASCEGAFSALMQYQMLSGGLRIYIPPSLQTVQINTPRRSFEYNLHDELNHALTLWNRELSRGLTFSFVTDIRQANVVIASGGRGDETRLIGYPDESTNNITSGYRRSTIALIDPISLEGERLGSPQTAFNDAYATGASGYNQFLDLSIQGDSDNNARTVADIAMRFTVLSLVTTQIFGITALPDLIIPDRYNVYDTYLFNGFSRGNLVSVVGGETFPLGNYLPSIAMQRLRYYLMQFKRAYGYGVRSEDDIELTVEDIRAYSAANHFLGKTITMAPFMCASNRKLYYSNSETITRNMFGESPNWLDLYSRGIRDFCTVAGNNIACYKNRFGRFISVLFYSVNDPGWFNSRIFLSMGSAGARIVKYCRLVNSYTHLFCNVYSTDKDGDFKKVLPSEDSGYLDGGWKSLPAEAFDDNRHSDTRWFVPVKKSDGSKGYLFCRLTGGNSNWTHMACRRIFDAQTIKQPDLESPWFDPGWAATRGWIRLKNGNPAFCRLTGMGSEKPLWCMEVSLTKMEDQKLAEVDPGVAMENVKWVHNMRGKNSISDALCRELYFAKQYYWSCLMANSNFQEYINYPEIDDLGWGDSLGFLSIGSQGGKIACGLVGNNTQIQCEGINFIVNQTDKKARQIDMLGKSPFTVLGGYRSVVNGLRAWFGDSEGRRGYFCRKLVGTNDLGCTSININAEYSP